MGISSHRSISEEKGLLVRRECPQGEYLASVLDSLYILYDFIMSNMSVLHAIGISGYWMRFI